MLGTSGNLSALVTEPAMGRNSDEAKSFEFLITVSGKDKGELTEDDFILVDEKGEEISYAHTPIRPHSHKPSAETLLHSTIYKHTNANSVFHVHTTNSTLLSNHMLDGQDKSYPYISFSGLEMLKGLGFKTHDVKISIPIIENSQDMKYLAGIVPSYINEDVPGLLLAGHGIYGWGKSVQEAKRHIEILEFLFEYRVKELSLIKASNL